MGSCHSSGFPINVKNPTLASGLRLFMTNGVAGLLFLSVDLHVVYVKFLLSNLDNVQLLCSLLFFMPIAISPTLVPYCRKH